MTFERRNPTRWPEHDLIEREYPRRGRHWIAEKIDKHPATVHAYAKRHGLELGDQEPDTDTSQQREEPT